MHANRSAVLMAVAALIVPITGESVWSEVPKSMPAEKLAASTLEHDIVALLADVDPASDLATLQSALAPKLAAAVEKQFDKLKPGPEPTVVESADGRFVVVVVGGAAAGQNGKDVRATSDAELLLVVGGRAGLRHTGGESYGGTGHAEATKGIGIGLGGAGGDGDGEDTGSGGGGAAGATGGVGSLAVGGPAGAPGARGGRGTSGSGVDPVRLDTVVKAAKAWNNRP